MKNNLEVSKICYTFAHANSKKDDSLAQQVEHNTFNVGVLGSNPKRITEERFSEMRTFSFFTPSSSYFIFLPSSNLSKRKKYLSRIAQKHKKNDADEMQNSSASFSKIIGNKFSVSQKSSSSKIVSPHKNVFSRIKPLPCAP